MRLTCPFSIWDMRPWHYRSRIWWSNSLVEPQKEECIAYLNETNVEDLEDLVALHEEEPFAHPKNEYLEDPIICQEEN